VEENCLLSFSGNITERFLFINFARAYDQGCKDYSQLVSQLVDKVQAFEGEASFFFFSPPK
jgi:hypothetical protein